MYVIDNSTEISGQSEMLKGGEKRKASLKIPEFLSFLSADGDSADLLGQILISFLKNSNIFLFSSALSSSIKTFFARKLNLDFFQYDFYHQH